MRAIALWMLAFGMMPILLGAVCGPPERPKCLDLVRTPADWEAAVEQAFADQSAIQSVDVFDPDSEVDTLIGAAAIIGCDPL